MNIEQLLSELTAEEKAALVAGTDFMFTNAVQRLGIPSVRTSDGPHGLRVQAAGGDNGVTGSLPATAFPTAATVAASWNPNNSRKIGEAIGREAHRYGVHVVLGPGVNIKRNPTAGRNFEYFSEDLLLAGKMAAQEVLGIQSQGVGATVKHFALNNAENYRFMGNSVADMRAMREIYLKVFEIVIKESAPAAVMCAYNRINGVYCSENKWLMQDILRDDWGFRGLVMTDWGAMHDRIRSLQAGVDLEMPGNTRICRKWILDGLKSGALSMQVLDEAVRNVLVLAEKYAKTFADDSDFEQHAKLACDVTTDSAVLMKNDGVLPLSEEEDFFVCGDLFERMRYQGAGSSMINPTKLISPKDAFDEEKIRYVYARGYAENRVETDQKFIDEALSIAGNRKKALVFVGLTDYVESEGCDRENMRLPQNQLALVDALVRAEKQVIVVLFGGSPVELPFADGVSAILNMYLPGQSGGKECADLLFGKANPCGRLAETWSLRYEDVPFGDVFGKTEQEVYKESIFVGYRYYTTANKAVRYPFGYGLSYTHFSYRKMKVKDVGDRLLISCEVVNEGEREGAEVVQLYAEAPQSKIFRAKRELRAFYKVPLKAGESALVVFSVAKKELQFFDILQNKWRTEAGEYELEFCSDCNTVVLSQKVKIEGEEVNFRDKSVADAYGTADLSKATDAVFEKMSALKIPPLSPVKPITLESRFSNLAKAGFFGKILYNSVLSVSNKQMKSAQKMPEGWERDNQIKGAMFMRRILESNSLVSMAMSAGNTFPYNFAEGFMYLSNGKIGKALKCLRTPIEVPPLPKDVAQAESSGEACKE